jgi:hypothetical protein
MVSFRNRWKKMNWMGSPLLSCGVLALVLAWPSYIIAVELPRNRSMTNQMKNISFCLVNLKFEEKVMCFSQQQVFFDPVFRFTRDRCGRSIHEMNPECFEKRMIDQQCRVVINDKRTRNLGPVIQEKIKRHFISARIGDILVPGMVIPPNGMVKERIWVSGPYYSPTRQLIINEKAIKKNIVILEKGEYVIKNMTRRPIHFSYVFKEKAKASSSGERNRSGR